MDNNNLSYFIVISIILVVIISVVLSLNLEKNTDPDLIYIKELRVLNFENNKIPDKLLLGNNLSALVSHFEILGSDKALVVYGVIPNDLLYWSASGYTNKTCSNIIGCTEYRDVVLILTASRIGFEIIRKEMKKERDICLITDPPKKAIYYHLIPDSDINNKCAILIKFVFRNDKFKLNFYSRYYDLKTKYEKIIFHPDKTNYFSEKETLSEETHQQSMRQTLEKHLKIYKILKIYPKIQYNNDILEYRSNNITIPNHKKLFITAIDHCSNRKAYFSCIHIVDSQNNLILNTWITGDHKNSLKNKDNGLYTHLLQTHIDKKIYVVEQIYMNPDRLDGFSPTYEEILPMCLFITNIIDN